jgi:tetratricopeptide (TPR) repeat protein
VLDAEELLKSLEGALEARPDLWHAWSAVVQQLCEMNRLEEAQKLASQATEKFSLLPRTWIDLAQVYRARNDADGEIAAVKQALSISPGWGQAVRQLAEVYERLGEFEKTRELLEQAIARSPLDAYNHGCLADLLWKQGDRTGALDRVRHAVKLEPGYQWAWDALSWWSRAINKPELAEQTARDLTVRRAGEARSWITLARMLRAEHQLDERLRALEKAIELAPRSLEAHDLRARLLADARRFDEALAACAPPVFGEVPPSRLRARAAWIDAERGNFADAIRQMRQVVAEEPNFYWAWTCLADWYRATKAKEDYLKTAEVLHRLWPLEAVPMGYLGEAKLWAGDREGARALLRETMARFPDYDFAAGTLFGIELEDGHRDSAAAALEVLKRHVPGPSTLSREVRFAAKFEDGPAAVAKFRALANEETPEDEPIDRAVDAMVDAKMRNQVIDVLRETLPREGVAPMIAGLLVEQLTKAGRWKDAVDVADRTMERGGELARHAAQSILYHCGNSERPKELKRFLKHRRAELARSTLLWGWVGYALQSVRDYKQCVRWMSDWRDRPDAEAWMLVNLAEAYRAVGRVDAAREIHHHAIKLHARPEPRSIHVLWLAADAALAGRMAEVTQQLARVDSGSIRPQHQFLRGVIDALVAARDHRSAKAVLAILQKARATYPQWMKDRELRRVYRSALRKLLAIHGGLFGRIVYLNRLLQS